MPFLLALVPVFEAIGVSAGTAAGSPLVKPDLHEHPPEHAPELPPSSLRLGISGRICRFYEKSTHMMLEVAPGEWKNLGNCFYMREGATPEFLEKFRGIPILAPNLKTEVGTVTRVWVEGDEFKVEGEIRDSEAARWTLTQKAGLCLQLRNTKKCSGPADQFSGTYECVAMNLRICLPGQGGFASSYVRFQDPTIKLEESDKPRSSLLWMDGHGW